MSNKEKLYYVLALIFSLLGAALLFGYTAMRFTGLLCACAAAVWVAFALLERRRKTKPWARWAQRVLLALLAAGFAFFAVLECWVISWSRTDNETPVEAVVVLGAGVNGTVPSLSLQVRLEAALDYIQDKPGVPIIVTGAQGAGEDVSEARCMADYLTARGVGPGRIILEEQAVNTAGNVRYSKELLAERGIPVGSPVAVVTSGYHLCRAAWLWGEGMVPVAASMPGRYFPLTANYYVREAFGMAAELVFR